MELGLSLGDPSKSFPLLLEKTMSKQQKTSIRKGSLDFCMAIGLSSKPSEPEKTQKSSESQYESSEADESDNNNQVENNLLQLALHPLAPVSGQIQSLPWSSDNGSSENGSSGNMAAGGFDVNRLPETAPAPAEEVSSAYPFSLYRNGNLLNVNKRGFEGNDVVEADTRGSDDDENALNTRKKLRLSKDQSAFLEESFKEHNTLNPKQKLALAKQLNLRPRQVEVWFQNRRARTKLKQTEVDCEYLKRCCETLTDENRRLHKELQELRALKTSNPFYMQLPATTLTMCPSCERVATTSTATPPSSAATKTNSSPKPIPIPLTRPRFYPFTQTSNHHNQPAAS